MCRRTVVLRMEELRVRGNALFTSDPRAAAALYQEAINLYGTLDDKAAMLDEYTKCAGNALTCLFKLQEYEACAALAHTVLAVNPLIAKAYAFIGRCALLQPSITLPRHAGALQYLCRAVYLLPSIGDATLPSIRDALELLLQQQQHEQCGQHSEEPCIEVRQGDCGNCVVAATPVPPMLAVSSTLHPFSVCAYEEVEEESTSSGCGVCANCGVVVEECADDGGSGTSTSQQACSRCRLVRYCSAACAATHAPQHEQHECRLLVRLREM
ncbi:SET and MYND domain-containing protein, partial [Trypanosoma grayi]|uniref:SET and MYND domain-containing protein n=1 Tax=Trypanosoma grayi TaxID=71804 RepID=UPI0004F3F920